jgi:hypothetical protein
MFTLIRTILAATIKGIGALALGGAILAMVARNCGPRQGVAYVHVLATCVDVAVDEFGYRVESLGETPIVCVLPPGRHTLRMSRDQVTLYEEEFVLEPGKEVVLCACESPSRQTDGDGGRRVGPQPNSVVLTASARRPRP